MTTRLRLFPLNAVLFPGATLNLHVFEARYKQLVGECLESGEGFGVVLIRDGDEAGDPAVEPHAVGCIAEIQEVTQLPFGRFYVSTLGRARFSIRSIVSREPYLLVDADVLDDVNAADACTLSLCERVRERFLEYARLIAQFSGQQQSTDVPAGELQTSFAVAEALQVSDSVKQRLLEVTNTNERLTMELEFMERLLPQLRSLLERRHKELQRRAQRGGHDQERAMQQRFFGKYFSVN